MTRDNLTRDEMLKQIAEHQWDHLCEDWQFDPTDLIIHGCNGLNRYTDDELNEIWDRCFADDDDDDDDELIEVLDRYIANNDDSE